MFSLRSNSIELRLRSVRRGNFWVNLVITSKKQKQLGIRFAHKFFILASLDLDAN
jgi:hypothetical protein